MSFIKSGSAWFIIILFIVLYCMCIKVEKTAITRVELNEKKNYIVCTFYQSTPGNFYIVESTNNNFTDKPVLVTLDDYLFNKLGYEFFIGYDKSTGEHNKFVFYGSGELVNDMLGEHVNFTAEEWDILERVYRNTPWACMLPNNKICRIDLLW